MELVVGTEFSSFKELSTSVKKWEAANFVTLYTRSSRGVVAARRRAPRRTFAEELKFSELDYACVHGGREYKSKSSKRLCQKTFLKNCPFVMKIRTRLDGQRLYVKEICGDHNHELPEEIFRHMPKQRRLDPEAKEEAVRLLKVKANKKLVQNHLISITGKTVTMKDIHNVVTKSVSNFRNDFQGLVQEMKRVKGATVTAFVDEDSMLKAIYFQTSEMKKVFESYPELLLVDATYKLNDLQMPLYVLMVVDGNGESEVVCLWLTQFEDKETITELVQGFKKHNSCWSSILCIMSDKDMIERSVFREQIPQSKLLICLFHTLRTMRREVSCEKLGISQGERSMCLEILSKMVYARSEEEYSKLYDDLKNAPQRVVEYFDDNWHAIRQEWVEGLKNACCNFMNRTNNRVESINQKLKSVISRYSGVTQFFHDLMKCLTTLKVERDHRALEVTMKRRVSTYSTDSAYHQYMSLLTPYSFEYVKTQLEQSNKVKIIQDIDEKSCSLESKGQLITSDIDSCCCGFVSAMKLPCKHIFAVRQSKSLSEFDEALCADRWKLQYFISNHHAYQSTDNVGGQSSAENNIVISQHVSEPILSEQQKYRKAFKLGQALSQQLSTFGMRDFNDGIEVLQAVSHLWEKGKKIFVEEATGDVSTDSDDDDVPEFEHIKVPPAPPQLPPQRDVAQPGSQPDCDTQDETEGVPKDQAMQETKNQKENLQVYVDEEGVIVKVHQKDDLISIAKMLKEMGHDIDAVLPHIRVNGAWISEREALDTKKDYHFYTNGTSCMEDDMYFAFRDESDDGNETTGTPSQGPLANADNDISLVKMPPTMRKRGRPKGAGLTVIGLPKKKGKSSSKPTPFVLRSEWEKTKVMLKWFVDKEIAERVMRGGDLIEEQEVESRPEKIPRKCLDENVCISQIKKHFSFDGWSVLMNSFEVMRTHGSWTCSKCCNELDSGESIACDSCLEWCHLQCAGLKRAPKTKHWFCRYCYSNAA